MENIGKWPRHRKDRVVRFRQNTMLEFDACITPGRGWRLRYDQVSRFSRLDRLVRRRHRFLLCVFL